MTQHKPKIYDMDPKVPHQLFYSLVLDFKVHNQLLYSLLLDLKVHNQLFYSNIIWILNLYISGHGAYKHPNHPTAPHRRAARMDRWAAGTGS